MAKWLRIQYFPNSVSWSQNLWSMAFGWKTTSLQGGKSIFSSLGCRKLCWSNIGCQSGMERSWQVLVGRWFCSLSGGVCDIVSAIANKWSTPQGATPGIFHVYSNSSCSKPCLESCLWWIWWLGKDLLLHCLISLLITGSPYQLLQGIQVFCRMVVLYLPNDNSLNSKHQVFRGSPFSSKQRHGLGSFFHVINNGVNTVSLHTASCFCLANIIPKWPCHCHNKEKACKGEKTHERELRDEALDKAVPSISHLHPKKA